MIGGPCFVAGASFGRGAPVARVRAAVAAVVRLADLSEGTGAGSGGRLELSLGAAHSGHLSRARERGAARGVRLEAQPVAGAVSVRGAGLAADPDGRRAWRPAGPA